MAQQNISIDQQALAKAKGDYAAVIPEIRSIVNNLDNTVGGSVAGWRGDAQKAFSTFAGDLSGRITALNKDLDAVSNALDAGSKAVANTEYDNVTPFTTLGKTFGSATSAI